MQNSGLGTECPLEFLLCHAAGSPDIILSNGGLPPTKNIAEDLGILDPVGYPCRRDRRARLSRYLYMF
jgi:hypothetical protein